MKRVKKEREKSILYSQILKTFESNSTLGNEVMFTFTLKQQVPDLTATSSACHSWGFDDEEEEPLDEDLGRLLLLLLAGASSACCCCCCECLCLFLRREERRDRRRRSILRLVLPELESTSWKEKKDVKNQKIQWLSTLLTSKWLELRLKYICFSKSE